MKEVYKLFVIVLLLVIVQIGCQDVTVGYLRTENAKYSPDTMEIKAILDPVEDARRIQFEIPWQSTSIEGVSGTSPIRYEIREIECDHGDVDSGSQIQMVRKGVLLVPYNHTMKPGRYMIHIRIWNEGYVHDVDSVFTVIVK